MAAEGSYRSGPGIGHRAVLRGHVSLAAPPSPLGGTSRETGRAPRLPCADGLPLPKLGLLRGAHCGQDAVRPRPTCSPRGGATAVCAPEQPPLEVGRRPRPHLGQASRHPQTVEKKEVRLTCRCAERSCGGNWGAQRRSMRPGSPPPLPAPRPRGLPPVLSPLCSPPHCPHHPPNPRAQHRVHFRVVKSFPIAVCSGPPGRCPGSRTPSSPRSSSLPVRGGQRPDDSVTAVRRGRWQGSAGDSGPFIYQLSPQRDSRVPQRFSHITRI